MIKNYKTYIKENIEIDKPFTEYPINVMPIWFKYKTELEIELKKYYEKFIGRKVTIDGVFLKDYYGKEKEYGIFTFVVKDVKYRQHGPDAPILYFFDGKTNYKVYKILSSQSMEKGKITSIDPYGEEEWDDPIIS